MSHAVAVCHGDFGRAAIYELDRTIITHAHREGHLIFFMSGARGRVVISDRSVPLDGDRAVAVSPWEPHSFHVERPDTACLTLVMYIKPLWFREHSPTAPYALSFGQSTVAMTERIAADVARLIAQMLDDDDDLRFDDILLDLTRGCFEQTWCGTEQGELLLRRCGRFSDHRVRRSLRLMQENFAEEVEMRHLAREVGLSRPHFFKLFKKQMGVTPNIYLNTLRSEQAIDDLLRTPKSVTDIAYDLGFSSQASFTRFFAANVGIAPSEYRRVAQIA